MTAPSTSTIGPYRIEDQIGRGAIGVVYRAVHSQSGARVALKTVHLPSAEYLHGIRREIQALARSSATRK